MWLLKGGRPSLKFEAQFSHFVMGKTFESIKAVQYWLVLAMVK